MKEHPTPSDQVTIPGMKHIQGCAQCRENFPAWLPVLDQAQENEPDDRVEYTRP